MDAEAQPSDSSTRSSSSSDFEAEAAETLPTRDEPADFCAHGLDVVYNTTTHVKHFVADHADAVFVCGTAHTPAFVKGGTPEQPL